MATQIQPEFSGGITEDFATLVELFRSEVRVAAGRSEPFFDTFSLAINDGISMLVSRPCDSEDGEDSNHCCEYNLEGLAAEQEALETQYWKMEVSGVEMFDADELVGLDQQVLDLYERSATRGHGGSLIAGAHVRFAGDASRPQWSLFIQNEGLRKIDCSAQAQDAVRDMFVHAAESESSPDVVFMSNISPYSPLCLAVPRAVLQLRAQCLNPDAILFARRGLALRASSPDQLWNHYCAITQKIADDARSRLRKLPWIFQGTGDMLPEKLVTSAIEGLGSCLEGDVSLKVWESSREGVLRKALCSPELVDLLEKGFPDLHTAGLGGLRPLVVKLGDSESASTIPKKIASAWTAYRKDMSENHPVPPRDDPHTPHVIVLANLGVVTTLADATEAQAAYSALAETVSVLEGARAYGGMASVPYEEVLPLAASPLRRPSAAEAIGKGLIGAIPSEGSAVESDLPALEDDQLPDLQDDDLSALDDNALSADDIRIRPPARDSS